jgi:glycosyltransferase involved in cell wall biosynthesis
MRCPTLKDLPPPPPGKRGWPWTEESPQWPDIMLDASPWPRISIVTPSFNQGRFIEETLRSVLLQGYPDLEYTVIDGGSTDGSIDIIRKYEPWLSHWVSEPDRGQSHAVNKGFLKATGRIHAYLNSDDLYEQGAFGALASSSASLDHEKSFIVAGNCTFFGKDSLTKVEKSYCPQSLSEYLNACPLIQPATFWSGDLSELDGGFDENLGFCFDNEFFLRVALRGVSPMIISQKLARFRYHAESKSKSQQNLYFEESIFLMKKYWSAVGFTHEEKDRLVTEMDKRRRYIQTFIQWKNNGRLAAWLEFLEMVLKYPRLLFKRDILGLAHRLLLVRFTKVVEIATVFGKDAHS